MPEDYVLPGIAPGAIMTKDQLQTLLITPTQGRIDELPSALGTDGEGNQVAVDLTAFLLLPVTIGANGAKAGGAIDMAGGAFRGWVAPPVRIDGDLTIDASMIEDPEVPGRTIPKWLAYAGRMLELTAATRITVTVDAGVPKGFGCTVLAEGSGGGAAAVTGADFALLNADGHSQWNAAAAVNLYRGTAGLWLFGRTSG